MLSSDNTRLLRLWLKVTGRRKYISFNSEAVTLSELILLEKNLSHRLILMEVDAVNVSRIRNFVIDRPLCVRYYLVVASGDVRILLAQSDVVRTHQMDVVLVVEFYMRVILSSNQGHSIQLIGIYVKFCDLAVYLVVYYCSAHNHGNYI